ncbi:MAG: hypothetical protein Q9220_005195 [cf. Caloplaca sp. 1 TL-2023]
MDDEPLSKKLKFDDTDLTGHGEIVEDNTPLPPLENKKSSKKGKTEKGSGGTKEKKLDEAKDLNKPTENAEGDELGDLDKKAAEAEADLVYCFTITMCIHYVRRPWLSLSVAKCVWTLRRNEDSRSILITSNQSWQTQVQQVTRPETYDVYPGVTRVKPSKHKFLLIIPAL